LGERLHNEPIVFGLSKCLQQLDAFLAWTCTLHCAARCNVRGAETRQQSDNRLKVRRYQRRLWQTLTAETARAAAAYSRLIRIAICPNGSAATDTTIASNGSEYDASPSASGVVVLTPSSVSVATGLPSLLFG
jgi:hypothetical protein